MKKAGLLIIYTLLIATMLNSLALHFEIIDKDLDIPLEGVTILSLDYGITVFTDEEGKAVLTLNTDDITRNLRFKISLIGYTEKKLSINDFSQPIRIPLQISFGELELSEELIIEADRIDITDEKTGESIVMDDALIKESAKIGLIQDAISSIKAFPGVGFSGKNNTSLSVHGGNPDELSVTIDDFFVRYPWHWQGIYSIFNPGIIDSIKFSTGIFNAKNSNTMSGLLEINTSNADDGFRFDLLTSTSTVDAFLHIPIKKSGLLIGGRVTFYDLLVLMTGSTLYDSGIDLIIKPYIRDAYVKYFFKPADTFEFYINYFFLSDGIHTKMFEPEKDKKEEITTTVNTEYYNYDTFINTGVKALLNDKIHLHALAGYEFKLLTNNITIKEQGKKYYSPEFREKYEFLLLFIGDPQYFNLNVTSDFGYEEYLNTIQAKINLDFNIHEKLLMSLGSRTVFDINTYKATGHYWRVRLPSGGVPIYVDDDFEIDLSSYYLLYTNLYLNFNVTAIPDILDIDTGICLDNNLLTVDKQHLITYPIPDVRFNMIFTPVKDHIYIKKMTLSTGAGLFSKFFPIDYIHYRDAELTGIFSIKNFMYTLGFDITFPHNIKIQLLGYYKFYFNRVYTAGFEANETHNDGIGHCGGFDIFLKRAVSRYIDGWISYSFVYTRLYNPTNTSGRDFSDRPTDPVQRWYYPDYHRFHTLSIVLNIKPTPFLTITQKFSFATGRPVRDYSDPTPFATLVNDYGIAEMYARSETYNDELRTGISIPYDIIVTLKTAIPRTQLLLEFYAGVEDLFSFLYKPASNVSTNKFTGQDSLSYDVNFDLGIPLVNCGIKLTY